jgi:serine/threonine protein kinase
MRRATILPFLSGVSPLPFDEFASFSPPSAFGPFRVLHQIGSGVLGPVFRTYDAERDRLVAVKAFRLDIVPEQAARLAEALRRVTSLGLKHPAIVAPMTAGLEGTTAYLAMDYVAAETLDVALRHLAPAPLPVTINILRQIADAIDAAWDTGLLAGHGALHPRDVFLLPASNDVRVAGFGVARALESVGEQPQVRRPYTAPERAAGHLWDARADVFSLGAIAHELLTGRRPAGPGEQDGALPNDVAPEQRVLIRRVLSKALAEQPADRFASAGAFVDALTAVANWEDVSALLPAATSSDATSRDDASTMPRLAAVDLNGESVRPSEPIDPGLTLDPALTTEPPAQVRAAGSRAPRPARPLPPPLVAPPPLRSPARFDSLDPELTPLTAPVSASSLMALYPRPAGFPWGAMAIVAIAGLVVGAVAGDQYGSQNGASVGAAVTTRVPAALLGNATTTAAKQPAQEATPAREPKPATAKPESVPPGTDVDVAATRSAVPPATPTPPSAPIANGSVVVTSTPSGALVTVDSAPRGRTPQTVRGLELGSHAVVVTMAGHVAETRHVQLSAATPQHDVAIELLPTRAATPPPPPAPRSVAPPAPARQTTPGALAPAAAKTAEARTSATTNAFEVDSIPRGAVVVIDGKRAGVTPLRVSSVAVGAHAVRIELSGYKSVVTNVSVSPDEPARLTVRLEEGQRALGFPHR